MEKQTPATGIPVNQAYSAPSPGHQYGNYQQPSAPYTPSVAPGQGAWSSGLCDCCGDTPRCCLTCCCPCITFGQIAEIVDKGSSSCGMAGGLYALLCAFTGCQCIYSCIYRTKMRKQYGIPGDEVTDCCTHFWCECCALSQMHRELIARGYDVSLGWDGNMARNQGGIHMAPVPPPAMTR